MGEVNLSLTVRRPNAVRLPDRVSKELRHCEAPRRENPPRLQRRYRCDRGLFGGATGARTRDLRIMSPRL